MKLKTYFFVISLMGSLLPTMALGVMGDVAGRAPVARSIKPQSPPVVADAQPGLLHLTFTSDLGVLEVSLVNATGGEVVNLTAYTTYRREIWINAEAGTYTLTVTNAGGGVVTQQSVTTP